MNACHGLLNLTPGEMYLLKCIEDASDEIRKLEERWNNRLVRKRGLFVERYLVGSLSVILNFKFAGKAYHGHYLAVRDGKCISAEGRTSSSEIAVDECRNRYCRDDEPVFVVNVDVMQSAEIQIPSLCVVWPNVIDDEVNDIGTSDLYLSAINGRYKFVRIFGKWKLDPFARRLTRQGDQVTYCNVESNSEIMNGIPKNRRQFSGNVVCHSHLEDAISRMRIRLYPEFAEISRDEIIDCGVEILDMFIGPFNL